MRLHAQLAVICLGLSPLVQAQCVNPALIPNQTISAGSQTFPDQVALTAQVGFREGFAGTKTNYLSARDNIGQHSGWQKLGTWEGGLNPPGDVSLALRDDPMQNEAWRLSIGICVGLLCCCAWAVPFWQARGKVRVRERVRVRRTMTGPRGLERKPGCDSGSTIRGSFRITTGRG